MIIDNLKDKKFLLKNLLLKGDLEYKTMALYSLLNTRYTKILDKPRSMNVNGHRIYADNAQLLMTLYLELILDDEYKLKHLKDVKIIKDIGGNIGMTSVLFADMFPDSIIDVYEPNPLCYPYLQKNIIDFKDRITSHNLALSNQFIYVDMPNNTSTSNSIEYNKNGKIPCIPASNIIGLNEYPDLVKIDTEGSEYPIIDDIISTGVIKRIKNLVIEFHFSERYNVLDYLTKINNNGFKIRFLTPGKISVNGLNAVIHAENNS